MKIRRTRLRHVEPLGWTVCATALVLGVAGLNAGNNILYLITGFLLAAVVVLGPVSRRSLRRTLRLSIDLPLPTRYSVTPSLRHSVTSRIA